MALEASLVGAPLVDMLAQRDVLAAEAEKEGKRYIGAWGFAGTVKQLLAELNEFMRSAGRPLPGRWPQTPHGMSAALRRIVPALRKLGHKVDFGFSTDRAHNRIVTIDTPLSYAHRSAHNGNQCPKRPKRPKPTASAPPSPGPSDISDVSDIGSATQTNGGHSKARANDAGPTAGDALCPDEHRQPAPSEDDPAEAHNWRESMRR
jgi:hypothetical protein